MSKDTEAQHSEASPQPTPGPWNYVPIGSGEFLITDPRPPLPGFMFSTVGKMGLNEADAMLAAAAPDLLVGLEAAVEALDAFDVANEMTAELRWMRTVIAKARGNQ